MKQYGHRRPLLVGLLGAALAPAIGIVVYGLIAASSIPASADDWIGIGLLFLLACAFALAGVVLFALPYVLWLRRRGWLSWPTVLAGSAVAGTIHLAGVAWLFSWNHQLPPVQEWWPGALLGLLSGVGFCMGAGPNNSFKPTPLRGAA